MKHDNLSQLKLSEKFKNFDPLLQEAIELDAWLNAYITVLYKELSAIKVEDLDEISILTDSNISKRVWEQMQGIYTEDLPCAIETAQSYVKKLAEPFERDLMDLYEKDYEKLCGNMGPNMIDKTTYEGEWKTVREKIRKTFENFIMNAENDAKLCAEDSVKAIRSDLKEAFEKELTVLLEKELINPNTKKLAGWYVKELCGVLKKKLSKLNFDDLSELPEQCRIGSIEEEVIKLFGENVLTTKVSLTLIKSDFEKLLEGKIEKFLGTVLAKQHAEKMAKTFTKELIEWYSETSSEHLSKVLIGSVMDKVENLLKNGLARQHAEKLVKIFAVDLASLYAKEMSKLFKEDLIEWYGTSLIKKYGKELSNTIEKNLSKSYEKYSVNGLRRKLEEWLKNELEYGDSYINCCGKIYSRYCESIYGNFYILFEKLPGENVLGVDNGTLLPVILLCNILNNELNKGTVEERVKAIFRGNKSRVAWRNKQILDVSDPLSFEDRRNYKVAIYGKRIESDREDNIFSDYPNIDVYERNVDDLVRLKHYFRIGNLIKTAVEIKVKNQEDEKISDFTYLESKLIRLFIINKYILNLSIIGDYTSGIHSSDWFSEFKVIYNLNNLVTNWYLSTHKRKLSNEMIEEQRFLVTTGKSKEFNELSGANEKEDIQNIITILKRAYICEINDQGLNESFYAFSSGLSKFNIVNNLPEILNKYLEFSSGELDGKVTHNFIRERSVPGWIRGINQIRELLTEIEEEEKELAIANRFNFLRKYRSQLSINRLTTWKTNLIKDESPIVYFHIRTIEFSENKNLKYVLVCGVCDYAFEKPIAVELIPEEEENLELFWSNLLESLYSKKLKDCGYIISTFYPGLNEAIKKSELGKNAKLIVNPHIIINEAINYVDDQDQEELYDLLVELYSSSTKEDIDVVFKDLQEEFGMRYENLNNFIFDQKSMIDPIIDFYTEANRPLIEIINYDVDDKEISDLVFIEAYENKINGIDREVLFSDWYLNFQLEDSDDEWLE